MKITSETTVTIKLNQEELRALIALLNLMFNHEDRDLIEIPPELNGSILQKIHQDLPAFLVYER